MANPFDQFTPPAAASANPFDQFDAKAAPIQSDASSKMSSIGRTLENALTLGGADWAYSHVPGMPSLQTQQAQTEAARQNVPAIVRYPAEIGAYVAGPGKFLGPAGEAIGGAGIGGVAAEGALAGGASAGFGSDFDPTQTAIGAGMGAGVGAAARGLTKGVNIGLQKALGKPGAVDPAAAIAATKQLRDEAYAPLKDIAFNPAEIVAAHAGATLTPGMAADVSSTMQSMLAKQRQAIQSGGNTANDIADYMSNLRSVSGAPGSTNGDKLLAGQTAGNLQDLLSTAKPITGQDPGQAASVLKDAQTAHQNYMMAQNLAEWQRMAAAGVPLGQAPVTEAEKYYQTQPAMYDALVNLYKKNQSQMDPSWALGHLAAGAIGDIGGAMFGFPGHFGGELLGYLGVKPMIKGAFKGVKQTATGKAIQQLYPQLTGQDLSGAQDAPQIGDALKNIVLGSVY